MIKNIIIIFSVMLILHGCFLGETKTAPTDKVFFSVTPVPTQITKIPIDSTVTPKPTSINTINPNCLSVERGTNLIDSPLGKIILYSQFPREAFLLDLQSGNKTNLNINMDRGTIYSYSTSPNGEWLAYVIAYDKPENNVIAVESFSNLKKEIRIPWRGENRFALIGWLDNNHLLFIQQRTPFYSTVMIDPFIEQQEEYVLDRLSDFPEIMDATLSYFESSNLVPDPLQKLIVYPQMKEGHYYITLWDLAERRVISRAEDKYPFKHDPMWATNGKDFVIALATLNNPHENKLIDEWFRVTRNGEVLQLSHFSDLFSYARIGGASRSPNGRYIAFLLTDRPGAQQPGRWLFFDMDTESLMSYCIQGSIFGTPKPLWSADSQYVVVTDQKDGKGQVILVDIKKGVAVWIADDVMPMGWLSNK